MTIDNPCGLPDASFEAISADASGQTTVGQLLSWGRRVPALFSSPGILSDVVVQDEFTHDVVVALTNGLVIVYGST
jgi:hypothetical protein